MNINFVKLNKEAREPAYASEGAGAFDFYATESLQLCYGNPVVIKTGLAVELPKDFAMLIYSRSGHGFNHNIRLGNCTGVIDSDYRGEIQIKLTMDFPSWQTAYEINPGDRVAQGLVIPVPRINFVEIDHNKLSLTPRGIGGLGSTGK